MTALSAEKQLDGSFRSRFFGSATLPVKDGEIIYAGATIAVVDGEWQNVTSATGLEGRYAEASANVDNTDDGKYLAGNFYNLNGKWLTPFRNDTGGSPVTAGELGDEVYFLDNQTVTIDATGRSKAGRVWKFGSDGPFSTTNAIVWVEVY